MGLFIHRAPVQCELELTRKAQTQLTPHIPLCLTVDPGRELTRAVLIQGLVEVVLEQSNARVSNSGVQSWHLECLCFDTLLFICYCKQDR